MDDLISTAMINQFTLDSRKGLLLSSIFSNSQKVIGKLINVDRLIRMLTIILIMILNPARAIAQNEPISIWNSATIPGTISDSETRAVEVGVKFRATVNGFITGIRFYKGPNNTGTHVGTLWSRTGTVLARATFTSETSTGWQQVLFSSPVAINAGTTYVASYHTNVGRYSINENYFTTNIGVNPVLQALRNGLDGGNGVYRYGANSIFPNLSFRSSNYWVDVLFTSSIAPDTTPPTVTANTPANGASGVSTSSVLTATFSEAINEATLNNTTFELRNTSNTLVPGTVSYNSTTRIATFTPSTGLAFSSSYTATIRGGTTDPRIKDAAGNALAANYSWNFTTANPTPLVVSSTSPANLATGVPTNSVIRAFFNQALNSTTVNSNTVELRNSSGQVQQTNIVYTATNLSINVTPSSPLNVSTEYTVTFKGGDTGIKGQAGNTLSADVVTRFTTTNQQTLSGPFSIWDPTTAPVPTPATDPETRAVELGVKFRALVDGQIAGIRFYKSPTNTGTHVATLWSRTGTNLARATFAGESASGWQQVLFTNPVAITAGTTYVASYHTNAGRYSISENFFTSTVTTPYLQALAQGVDGPNGVYRYSSNSIFPNSQDKSSNYWVDVLFVDNSPPRVTATTPPGGATSVSTTSSITATFSEGIDPATLNSNTFELRNAANSAIPGVITYNSANRTVTLAPSSALANSTVYTATLRGGTTNPQVKDAAGNALASNYSWSFTTAAAITPSITATSPANGSTGIAINANLTATFDREIDPATLTNTTFTLRNASNTTIPATVTYNSGTRTATLEPTGVLANQMVYTATLKGGATDPRVKDAAGNPLAADFVWSFTTIATAPLTVTANTPGNAATGVSTTADISATFNNEIDETTLTSSTFELRNSGNTVIPGTLTYSSATGTATLTPTAPLANSTAYTATLKGGLSDPRIKDLAGNALPANFSWSFTTAAVIAPVVTATSPENGAIGISRTTTVSAVFDLQMNSATITNSTFELRNNNNTLIPATINYNSTSRTATLTPSEPLEYSAVYTAILKGGTVDPRVKDINGRALATDYVWSFSIVAAPALTVIDVIPQDGTTAVLTTSSINATFNHDINPATLSGSTFVLRNASNTIIPGTLSYNPETRTATLMPSAPLANSTLYRATLKGGSTDPRIKDVNGIAMAADYLWSFTTVSASPPTGSFSIWPETALPVTINSNDAQPVELGVKFRASTDGFITGIKFYKSASNTGTHIGNLWSRSGTNLARAIFSGETATGWQKVLFDSPVAISSGTTYVASYFTPTGNYSFDAGYFTNPESTDQLVALQNGVDGPNGVFSYSSATSFPTSTFNSTNYWVDVVFETTIGPDVKAPTVVSTSPSDLATGINVSSGIIATFSEPLNATTVNNTTFVLKNAVGQTISAAISYSATSRTVTLTPSSPLEYFTNYLATLKGIRDQAGNEMVDFTWTFRTGQAPPLPPSEGPGGPILVVSAASNPFSRYAVEILRAEGLNEFRAMDISTVTSSVLSGYDVVILGEQTLTLSQVTMFTDWVNAGGTFVSFKPDLKLASLLGITRTTGTAANEYMLVNAAGPGEGIVNETIQYHGTADLYTLNGATALATLYSTASTARINPAVTSRNVGVNGGQAIAFTYDLARSVVYTRQGNPMWEGQDRDGLAPVRSNDLYYGNASFDRKPDWIDFKKVAIPQADEQQRLLANIIIQGNLDRKPLPRFWYLPKGFKAAVVMTGDDHANGGTVARFNHYKSISTSNTADAVADWTAIRSTSYIYPNTPITNTQLNAFQADGFEIALHLNTNCGPYTETSWLNSWNSQWNNIKNNFPGLNIATTNRTHCLPWSDWTSQPKAEASKGIRIDANYYYWPGSWVQSRAGMFTGSGLPMRFADLNGNIIDCYQVTTQVTDESDINNYSVFISSLLDKAKGPEGFYGTFCANMHTDEGTSSGSTAIINSAVARGIPVISAQQLLTWLDGRNNSAFKSLAWSNNELNFDLVAAEGSRNLKGMLPFRTLTLELNMILLGSTSVPFTRETIKGIEYAFFDGKNGNYTAIYGNSTQPLARISDIAEMNLLNSNQSTLEQDIKLSVFPNPFAEYATAEFSTPRNEQKVYLDVYNVNGVKIKQLYEGPTLANELNRFGINSLNLPPGVYFIHFITPEKTVTTKIITN